MSKIEDALGKLRKQPAAVAADVTRRHATVQQSGGTARNSEAKIDGPRHHVSQSDLVRQGLLAPLNHRGPTENEFRRIKRPLIDNALNHGSKEAGDHMNVIMVASSLPRAGKTFCAINLAVSISLERELSVLLVDADVAKPHISAELGLSQAPGLIDLLLDERRDLADALVWTDFNDIQVLPAGSKHAQATELLASARMSHILRELAVRYPDRIIILDSPPLLLTSEAQALARQVGQILLIVEEGKTPQQLIAQTIETLDPTKAINLIVNKSRHWGQIPYYGGSYGYYGYARS